MPTGKRASMREGPLAALFRKTTEDAPGGETPRKPAPEREGAPPEARTREPVPEPAEHAEVEVEHAVTVPTPQERLRQAFSSDVPHSLLDPPGAQPAETEDPFARPQRFSEPVSPYATGVGPVIRVVGVGGAGVNAINRMVEAEIEGVEFLAINTDLQS